MSENIIWPGGTRRAPVLIRDSDGTEIEIVYVDSTSKGHPVFSIDGAITLPQLRRITHILCMVMVDGDLSAQTAAGWARDEDLGKIVTGEADDDR